MNILIEGGVISKIVLGVEVHGAFMTEEHTNIVVG